MRIISKKPFNDAATKHPDQRDALMALYRVLRRASFASPDEMRKLIPTLDNFKYREKWWVIDVAGNNLRLIDFIQFQQNRMYIKHIVTHAEYDKLTKKYRSEKEKKS